MGEQRGALRALLVTRLSVVTDATTSPERQEEITTHAATMRGFKIVGIADDLDVSATKYAPWERPKLGAWINNRTDEFDVIVFWRLDRFVRKVSDFAKMIEWCREHGKNLVSATESFDLSTPMGEAMAYLIAVFAQMEARNTSTRVTGAHAHLRKQGRWGGGQVPYGLTPAPADGGGYVLVHDSADVAVIKRMVADFLSGKSLNQIARELNAEERPTPADSARIKAGKEAQGKRWSYTGVLAVLKSRTLLGEATHKGEVVRDDDGMPVRRSDPIIDRGTWEQVQDKIAGNAVGSGKRSNASMLLGVAYCGICGKRLYIRKRHNEDHAYYRCSSKTSPYPCGNRWVRAEWLEDALGRAVLSAVGDVERTVTRRIPAQDHSEELDQAQAAYADLSEQVTHTRSATGRKDLMSKLARLDERIAHLESLPYVPARDVQDPTGETFREYWGRLDKAGRQRFLVESDVRAWWVKVPPGHRAWVDASDPSETPVVRYDFVPGEYKGRKAEDFVHVTLGVLADLAEHART